MAFKLSSPFHPAGDQPQAIQEIIRGIQENRKHQVLLGVTGSGKTYTISNVIAQINRPTLVVAPNKVLAAQLYAEFKSFFPKNAVEFFISYYDYYQPEAYIPQTDLYIEKDSAVNDQIDRLRLKATSSLISRRDVIVVASVSCIYNIGSPENYKSLCLPLETGTIQPRGKILENLIQLHYERNEVEFKRGKFRVKGNVLDIFPAYAETAVRVELQGDTLKNLWEIHPLTGKKLTSLKSLWIYPAKHFVTTPPELERALHVIDQELQERLGYFKSRGKLLEAQRLEQRTHYDMEMMRELGFCHGIENYSRPLSGRQPGDRPFCLLDYFPKDVFVIIDESHVSLPQVRGMYEGDRARKEVLVEYGFRLPSAMDNRPLKFNEFESLVNQTVYVSATPGPYELQKSQGLVVEQVIRPTGLVDPAVTLHPTEGQIPHLIGEIQKVTARKERVLVTTLTKKTAEDLASYLTEKKLRVRYLHSDIDALTRVEILKDLRKGLFDVLVGINLLREGLDLPEVALVAILDADNEGFLRSETTLIQIAGRAARNVNGRVILYANQMTGSMKRALSEMDRRRKKQEEYNRRHKITPRSIQKAVQELEEFQYEAKREGLSLIRDVESKPLSKKNIPLFIKEIEKKMTEAADNLDFELAAVLRDQLFELKEMRAGTPVKK
ncbi:MAG: excinuclease ABC subunit UvrB [Elusimicrobia bacterium]|nr:excinuclease ABC subunit UvrB [Elusimicrobiota bacterium]